MMTNDIIQTDNNEVVTIPDNNEVVTIPHRKKVKQFLMRLAAGENKVNAFKSIFPVSKTWSYTKIYSHINAIVSKANSINFLKHYRDSYFALLDQKKVDLLMYLENEIIYNEDVKDDGKPKVSINDKIRAIESYAKLAGFDKQIIQPIVNQVTINQDKNNQIKEIFGIMEKDDDNVVDADYE